MPKEKKEFFCRCGICDEDFTSREEFDAHMKTPKHQKYVAKYKTLSALGLFSHMSQKEMVERIRDEEGIFGKERRKAEGRDEDHNT